MTMITLTDTLTVGLPLEVLGWPERVINACSCNDNNAVGGSHCGSAT